MSTWKTAKMDKKVCQVTGSVDSTLTRCTMITVWVIQLMGQLCGEQGCDNWALFDTRYSTQSLIYFFVILEKYYSTKYSVLWVVYYEYFSSIRIICKKGRLKKKLKWKALKRIDIDLFYYPTRPFREIIIIVYLMNIHHCWKEMLFIWKNIRKYIWVIFGMLILYSEYFSHQDLYSYSEYFRHSILYQVS